MHRRLALAMVLASLPLASRADEVTATIRFQTFPGQVGPSRYVVSFPHSVAIPDVANSLLPGDKCDLGAGGGDGEINSDDLICWTWAGGDPSARAGVFQLGAFLEDECRFTARTAITGPLGVFFTGSPFPFDPTVAYEVRLSKGSSDAEIDFTKTMVDDCDPGFAGHVYREAACPLANGHRGYLWVPYDYPLGTLNGLLCGRDTCDGGEPCPNGPYQLSRCDAGMYEGGTSWTSGRYVSTCTVEGPADYDTAEFVSVCRTVARVLGRDVLAGVPQGLEPGEGAILAVRPTHPTIHWNPERSCGQQ